MSIAWKLAFPIQVFISLLVCNMCENLYESVYYESVYFKELHNDQEYYWPTIYRAGATVVSTITSNISKMVYYEIRNPLGCDADQGRCHGQMSDWVLWVGLTLGQIPHCSTEQKSKLQPNAQDTPEGDGWFWNWLVHNTEPFFYFLW